MPSNAASRCCAQLGLVRRFSSALSISSPMTSSSQSKVAPKAFSTIAHAHSSNSIISTFSTPLSPQLMPTSNNSSILSTVNDNNASSIVRRTMGTSNRKVIDAKNAKRLKIQQKKKKNTNAKKVCCGLDIRKFLFLCCISLPCPLLSSSNVSLTHL